MVRAVRAVFALSRSLGASRASATGGWVVGKILTQNAASLVGKYYIFYVGR